MLVEFKYLRKRESAWTSFLILYFSLLYFQYRKANAFEPFKISSEMGWVELAPIVCHIVRRLDFDLVRITNISKSGRKSHAEALAGINSRWTICIENV